MAKSIPLLDEDKQKILENATMLDKARSNAWAGERLAKQRGDVGVQQAVEALQKTLKALSEEYLADEDDKDNWSINLDDMEFCQAETDDADDTDEADDI